jgi:hypothetical protein
VIVAIIFFGGQKKSDTANVPVVAETPSTAATSQEGVLATKGEEAPVNSTTTATGDDELKPQQGAVATEPQSDVATPEPVDAKAAAPVSNELY